MTPQQYAALSKGWALASKRKVPSSRLTCPVCHKSFIRRGNAKFQSKIVCCSVSCAAKKRIGVIVEGFNHKPKTGPTLKCKVCGKLFYSFPSWTNRKYCSMKCRDKDPATWDHTRGPNHYNWKGGVASENQIQRKSKEYQKWRKAVFQREKYTCNVCKHHGKGLEAHHRKHWAHRPEIRFDVSNGITLCKKCHRIIHQWSKRLAEEYEDLRSQYAL